MAVRVSFGQYYSARSPIHALDARVKFVVTVAFMVSCFFVNSVAALALAIGVLAVATRVARVPFLRLVAQIRPVMALLAVTSIVNLFFVHTGPVVLGAGPVQIHAGGISSAVFYTVRFSLLTLAGGLLMLTTTPTALADGTERLLSPLERIGVPVTQTALTLSIALRFVPTISQEMDNIVAAQTARGADLENKGALAFARACVPLAVPLFASAIRHADRLGQAMDARCYTGQGRTHYHVLKLRARRDLPFALAAAAYLAALVALNVLGV